MVNSSLRGITTIVDSGDSMTIAGAQERIDAPASLVDTNATLRVGRVVLWAVIAAKILALWGLQWDIRWHIRIGRDSAFIPPHLMMYAGVAIIVLLCFGMLARDTWRRRRGGTIAGRVAAGGGKVAAGDE